MTVFATMTVFALLALFLRGATCQFPPKPQGITVLESRFHNDVKISYKENDICETTPGVSSYTGYVHIPPKALEDNSKVKQDYPINTFFWFYEARKNPKNAPLAIWLNGGPGCSSLIGMFGEVGPCWVNADSNSTRLNEWSWNNEVNMLFIDEPSHVGFSYDELVNTTTNLKYYDGNITVLKDTDPIPQANFTFLVGTDATPNENRTTRGTTNSAFAFWHFAQAWFQEFPHYSPRDGRISLAAESYGGKYGPAFFTFFREQNERIKNGTWKVKGEQHLLHLDTLIIVNGFVDSKTNYVSYPDFANNNTYGIKMVSDKAYQNMTKSIPICMEKQDQCIEVRKKLDPDQLGFNDAANKKCEEAAGFCNNYVQYDGKFGSITRDLYDISLQRPEQVHIPFYKQYLQQPHVQLAIGVAKNWTECDNSVGNAFYLMGDGSTFGYLDKLAYLLESGVKVSLIYGDRDYLCNWFGGEDVSLAIPWKHQNEFRSAGYEDIRVNSSYVGGHVRQYGPLSFNRVFQAGHQTPGYQPETAYRLFMRALNSMDLATGTKPIVGKKGSVYASRGIMDSRQVRSAVPPQPKAVCYVPDINATCTKEQFTSVLKGEAVVRNWFLVNDNSTALYPDLVKGK